MNRSERRAERAFKLSQAHYDNMTPDVPGDMTEDEEEYWEQLEAEKLKDNEE